LDLLFAWNKVQRDDGGDDRDDDDQENEHFFGSQERSKFNGHDFHPQNGAHRLQKLNIVQDSADPLPEPGGARLRACRPWPEDFAQRY